MSTRLRLARLILLAAGTVSAYADDLESLHILNANLDFRPGWTLQLHTRGRTFENAGSFNQFRVGPILMWQALPRLNVLGGYYFTRQNTRVTHRPFDLQRYWGGVQTRAVKHSGWFLDTRHLLERFNPKPDAMPDYWRHRHRALVTLRTPRVQPFFSGEALSQHRDWYGRYGVGIQFRPQPRFLMSVGWEYRQALSGPASHVITTMFQFDAYRYTPPHVD